MSPIQEVILFSLAKSQELGMFDDQDSRMEYIVDSLARDGTRLWSISIPSQLLHANDSKDVTNMHVYSERELPDIDENQIAEDQASDEENMETAEAENDFNRANGGMSGEDTKRDPVNKKGVHIKMVDVIKGPAWAALESENIPGEVAIATSRPLHTNDIISLWEGVQSMRRAAWQR